MWKPLFASLALVGLVGTAHAEPALKPLNGRSVHVAVAQKGKKAVAVNASASGWRLELRAADDGVAEVFDVTPGSPTRTWTLAMNRGLVTFDRARFVGGHTYRVSLHVDTATTGVGFVYLHPEPRAKVAAPERPRVLRFGFGSGDAQGSDESAGPTVADKGHL